MRLSARKILTGSGQGGGRPVTTPTRRAVAAPAAGVSLRIDLPTGRVGPGKIALLEAIAREGSISAAGRSLGMSYRRAWDLVDALNRLLGSPAVTTATGGAGGGGAALTPAGRALMDDYRAIETAARVASAGRLRTLSKRVGLGSEPPPRGPPTARRGPG